MAKLEKEFQAFYDDIKFYANNEVREKKENLKGDFKDSFPAKFKEYFENDFLVSDIRFIDQGSYKIGTTINHENKSNDIDVATIINLNINQYSNPIEIKKIARDALTHLNREPNIKEPCITVKYTKADEEKFHIDFPIYANFNDELYLARGKEFSDSENIFWEKSDPEGLNDYFLKDNLQIDGLDLSEIDKGKRKQKKRLVRYIKWWKEEEYLNCVNKNEIPPSIALTLLICKYFKYSEAIGIFNDLQAFSYTIDTIIQEIFYEDYSSGEKKVGLKDCCLPTKPYCDCFSKLKASEKYVATFYTKMIFLQKKLNFALNEPDERKAAEAICKIFGKNFPLPEKDKANAQDSFA